MAALATVRYRQGTLLLGRGGKVEWSHIGGPPLVEVENVLAKVREFDLKCSDQVASNGQE